MQLLVAHHGCSILRVAQALSHADGPESSHQTLSFFTKSNIKLDLCNFLCRPNFFLV